jgi:hypothetical protein
MNVALAAREVRRLHFESASRSVVRSVCDIIDRDVDPAISGIAVANDVLEV